MCHRGFTFYGFEPANDSKALEIDIESVEYFEQKFKLKDFVLEHLSIEIQKGSQHSPAEDAYAALCLFLFNQTKVGGTKNILNVYPEFLDRDIQESLMNVLFSNPRFTLRDLVAFGKEATKGGFKNPTIGQERHFAVDTFCSGDSRTNQSTSFNEIVDKDGNSIPTGLKTKTDSPDFV